MFNDATGVPSEPATIRHLSAGEYLFREGGRKTAIYRVESGAVCVYALAAPQREAFLEFAYCGDWLGFGYLDTHVWRARAVAATCLTCFSLSSVDAIITREPRAKEKLSDAIEREFALVRRATLARDPPNPLERVAAFLLSLAAVSRNEGRDPDIIAESAGSGLVADCLTMSVSTLSACLVELEQRGLIEPRLPDGLRIKDFAALEAVAEGTSAESANVERTTRERSLRVDYHEIL